MLPQHLQSSYQQYKADTDHIATWLATTAQRCGFTLNLQVAEEATRPMKLKGRARKRIGLRAPLPQFRTASRELLEIAAEKVSGMISADVGGLVSSMMKVLYNVEFEVEQED
ncbi:uncharacterized protein PV07_06991 [Cladophialophora immunda]|uniref:DUF6604 domain-containing protein n=1 Tax=Cladophialophora immunda TaxID=569365 RepID=A0A0D2C7V1_9EURO|nr:uncharacterized protein PV07_06991 [Cladophialophora immunda]KIW27233.1 hypothetical protein PV07_06991 [Cladophialophora immunda]